MKIYLPIPVKQALNQVTLHKSAISFNTRYLSKNLMTVSRQEASFLMYQKTFKSFSRSVYPIN